MTLTSIIFQSSKTDASLRLFNDYLGLKLLWSWMIDLDKHNESLTFVECKAKVRVRLLQSSSPFQEPTDPLNLGCWLDPASALQDVHQEP